MFQREKFPKKIMLDEGREREKENYLHQFFRFSDSSPFRGIQIVSPKQRRPGGCLFELMVRDVGGAKSNELKD